MHFTLQKAVSFLSAYVPSERENSFPEITERIYTHLSFKCWLGETHAWIPNVNI